MINLLSKNQTKQFQASVANNTIIRYVFLLISTLLAIGISTGIIFIATLSSKASLETELEDVKRQAQQFADTKKKLESLRKELTDTEAIIDKQVNYSKLLTAFSSLLPGGVTINAIAIDTDTILSTHTAQLTAPSNDLIIATKQAMLKSKLIETASIDLLDTSKGDSVANFTYSFNKEDLAEVIK